MSRNRPSQSYNPKVKEYAQSFDEPDSPTDTTVDHLFDGAYNDWDYLGTKADALTEGTLDMQHAPSLDQSHVDAHNLTAQYIESQVRQALNLAINQGTDIILGRTCRFFTRQIKSAMGVIRILPENPDRRFVLISPDVTAANKAIWIGSTQSISAGSGGSGALNAVALPSGAQNPPVQIPHRGELFAVSSVATALDIYIIEVMAN